MSISLYLHPKKYKDGTSPVMARIIEGKKVSYKTICKVESKDWDDSKKRVKRSNFNFLHLNNLISKKFSEYEAAYLESQLNENHIEAIDIFEHEVKQADTVISVYHKYMIYLKTQINEATEAKYKSMLGILNEFAPKDLIKKLNNEWAGRFVLYLKNDRGNTSHTIHKRLSFIKSLLAFARKQGLTNNYIDLKIKRESVKKEKLTIEEIEMISNLDLSYAPVIENSRNVFLMQYYCYGSRISDVLTIKKTDIKENRISIIQNKTSANISIKITDKIQSIIDKYIDLPGTYLFPFLNRFEKMIQVNKKEFVNIGSCNTLINKNLTIIAKKLNIEKHISTHVARHTFATHADKVVLDKRHISKALGHSTFKMTENYLSDLRDDEIDDSMSNIFK